MELLSTIFCGSKRKCLFLVSRIFLASFCCISPHLSLILDRAYSPVALQQRIAAELQYLETIEESVRQLGDVERLIGVSVARQESVSLAQMLQVKNGFAVLLFIFLSVICVTCVLFLNFLVTTW